MDERSTAVRRTALDDDFGVELEAAMGNSDVAAAWKFRELSASRECLVKNIPRTGM